MNSEYFRKRRAILGFPSQYRSANSHSRPIVFCPHENTVGVLQAALRGYIDLRAFFA